MGSASSCRQCYYRRSEQHTAACPLESRLLPAVGLSPTRSPRVADQCGMLESHTELMSDPILGPSCRPAGPSLHNRTLQPYTTIVVGSLGPKTSSNSLSKPMPSISACARRIDATDGTGKLVSRGTDLINKNSTICYPYCTNYSSEVRPLETAMSRTPL